MMLLIQTDEQSWFYLDRCAKKQKAPFERDTRTELFCCSAKPRLEPLPLRGGEERRGSVNLLQEV